MFNALAKKLITILNIHRLGRGLPGYLILFAPRAFVPQRQFDPDKRLRQLVVPIDIYEFYLFIKSTLILYQTPVLSVLDAKISLNLTI
jgi:hypothetical protein